MHSGSGKLQDRRIHEAIDLIYACSLDPEQWPHALESVAEAMQARGAFLFWGSLDGGFKTLSSPGIAFAVRLYQDVWWKHDLRNQRVVERGLLFAGQPVTDDDLVDDGDRRSHPFYRDFLDVQGFSWFVGAPVLNRPKFPLVLSVQRDTGRFHPEDKERCMMFARHMERALLVSLQLIEQSDLGMSLAEALGRMGRGVFLVAEDGGLVYANEAGQAMIGDGLVLRSGRLGAQLSSDEAKLAKAVARIASDSSPGLPPPFSVSRANRLPLAIHVLPVGRKGRLIRDILRRAAAIVVVIDPEKEVEIEPGLLRELLGLSPAEARVAAIVGGGRTPAEAAARLGLKEQTVRGVLKAIYGKLGISRQGQLVALIATLLS